MEQHSQQTAQPPEVLDDSTLEVHDDETGPGKPSDMYDTFIASSQIPSTLFEGFGDSDMSASFVNLRMNDDIVSTRFTDDQDNDGETDHADLIAEGISDISKNITSAVSNIEPLSGEVHDEIDDMIAAEQAYTHMEVCAMREGVEELYATEGSGSQYSNDAGWDVRFVEDCTIQPNETVKLPLGIAVACFDDREHTEEAPFWLIPRSSIATKTPLRMANSVGLIDCGYRGELQAVVDNRGTEPFEVKRGTRLFQLVGRHMWPFRWSFVKKLSETERGSDGFGSTGT